MPGLGVQGQEIEREMEDSMKCFPMLRSSIPTSAIYLVSGMRSLVDGLLSFHRERGVFDTSELRYQLPPLCNGMGGIPSPS